MAQVTPVISFESVLGLLFPLISVFLVVWIIKLIVGTLKEVFA